MNAFVSLRSRTADLSCALARGLVVSPAVANPRVIASHADRCLSCQAEAARERALERALSALGSDIEHAPVGLVSSVVNAIGVPEVAQPAPASSDRAELPQTAPGPGWLVRHNRQVAAASASAMALGVALLASRRLRAAGV